VISDSNNKAQALDTYYSHIKLLRNSFSLFLDECFVFFRYFPVSK
jgi:hypothetical protein